MRRWLVWVIVSIACGIPLGYFYFYSVMPNVCFPSTARVPLYVPAMAALGMGLAVGLIVDGMDGVIVSAIGSMLSGGAFAAFLALSPMMSPEIDSLYAGDIALGMLRLASPVILGTFVCLIVGGFFGQYFNDDAKPDDDIFTREAAQ